MIAFSTKNSKMSLKCVHPKEFGIWYTGNAVTTSQAYCNQSRLCFEISRAARWYLKKLKLDSPCVNI